MLDDLELTQKARRHFAETSSYAAVQQNRYLKWHELYAPRDGDQWPEDRTARPGMIHITHNIIQPAVDTESRIESLLPRLTLQADTDDPETRALAELAEKVQKRWLEDSEWETWMGDAAKVKSMLGKVVLKPYWNSAEKRPDVSVLETPGNLRIGWGSSDYKMMDWALYEYTLSPLQAMEKFPDLDITPVKASGKISLNVIRHSDHADPLTQMPSQSTTDAMTLRGRRSLSPSTYENTHVKVWDYWCKTRDGEGTSHITNAFFVEGVLAAAPVNHDYYPDIPFIVIEHDHEPGSPEGLGDIEPLIDIQIELNRAYSHWAQLIADEIDPAWQVDADSIPGGIVPKGGQIMAMGEGKTAKPFEKAVNQFPIRELTEGLMQAFHFRSGLAEILFALPPGAQTAGRAMQIQIEASANRIDPRRRRFYRGVKELLIFWAIMGERINPQIKVGNEPGANPGDPSKPVMKPLKEILGDFRRWKFVAPEITPRDSMELVTTVVNKLNAKLISLEDAMDELGVDSPLEMIRKIEQERMNPKLFPGDVQGYVAVLNMLQALQAAQATAGGPPTVPGADPNAAGQGTQQPAAPAGVQGDNASGVPQPATAVGGPPPSGTGGPLQNQTLIRAQPDGGTQALQQIKVTN